MARCARHAAASHRSPAPLITGLSSAACLCAMSRPCALHTARAQQFRCGLSAPWQDVFERRNESFDVALSHAVPTIGPQQMYDLRSIASAATLPEVIADAKVPAAFLLNSTGTVRHAQRRPPRRPSRPSCSPITRRRRAEAATGWVSRPERVRRRPSTCRPSCRTWNTSRRRPRPGERRVQPGIRSRRATALTRQLRHSRSDRLRRRPALSFPSRKPGRRSHSLWSRRSSSSGVTAARRRASLPAPGVPQLPPHPESPQAPAASPPRSEQPPSAAHPADVVPDAFADTDSAAAVTKASSTQPAGPGGGVDGRQVSQASPTAGHDAEADGRDPPTAAAAEHDKALQETARDVGSPALSSSPPRVPPLRLGSLDGSAARQPQAMPRWVTLTLVSCGLRVCNCEAWLVLGPHHARQGASE